MEVVDVRAQFPKKLLPLFRPRRYKVLYGGRGGQIVGVARAPYCHGRRSPVRILCAREVQKSMKDSVHRLLKDQITSLDPEQRV